MPHQLKNPLPEFKTLTSKKLVGQKLSMSFAHNKTFDLWKGFKTNQSTITSALGTDLYSIQLYPEGFFINFDPTTEFEKWAAIEVPDFENIPTGMEVFTLPSGLYAVFYYTGAPQDGAEIFRYILQDWLPQSGYELDNRPHFEVLGARYKNGTADSEEEIWIPIR
jgi:AraC family transcriptional regulator